VIEAQIKLLHTEKQLYETKKSGFNAFSEYKDLNSFVDCFKKAYAVLDSEDKQRLIKSLILKIHVDTKKQISEIVFNFPL
jgi:hypothetical protein